MQTPAQIKKYRPKAYSELWQTSKMKLFLKIQSRKKLMAQSKKIKQKWKDQKALISVSQ